MKAKKLLVQVGSNLPLDIELESVLLQDVPMLKRPALIDFIRNLFSTFTDMQFTYLEINPLVVMNQTEGVSKPQIYFLDLAAKLDNTAEFECGKKWSLARKCAYPSSFGMPSWGPPMEFPAPFGREMTIEEVTNYSQSFSSIIRLTSQTWMQKQGLR